jgi:ankyrin repeat protein
MAAEKGHFDMVKCLIEHGADIHIQSAHPHVTPCCRSFTTINIPDNSQHPALDIAVAQGHDEVATFLLEISFLDCMSAHSVVPLYV